jgi:hypothetical protein
MNEQVLHYIFGQLRVKYNSLGKPNQIIVMSMEQGFINLAVSILNFPYD